MSSTLIDAALALAARGIPSFPTVDKIPSWSNAELGVAKGDGGYKIATTDQGRLRELFAHECALEIAVPMGEMSGLMCVDVDVHKVPSLRKWVDEETWLHATLQHETRSGGMHFFFKHPGNHIKFPATLREGVDIKAVGNGYVCFPPTKGYSVEHDVEVQDFPLDVLRDAMKAKGGTGSITLASSWNDASDEELIARIKAASDLYPALRSLSYRLPDRKGDDGRRFTVDQQIEILEGVMAMSAAAKAGHERHEDWVDRRSKIADLVESAMRRHTPDPGGVTEEMLLEGGKPFMTAAARPIGPVRQPSRQDIRDVEPEPVGENEFVTRNPKVLQQTTLPPMQWVIPGVIPAKRVGSIAGASNVSKTYYVCALAVAMSYGRSELLGLPPMSGKVSSLIVTNEEDVEDVDYRLKAPSIYYDTPGEAADIIVRGNDDGMFTLVAKNEVGSLEIDMKRVRKLVDVIIAKNIGVIFMDPYNTLSIGGEENSNDTHPILTNAFNMLCQMTGCSVVHIHHTKKGSGTLKNYDEYSGDRDAWRGGGSIFSALHYGFTLANWMPQDKAQRAIWKGAFNEHNLGRFVELAHAKSKRTKKLPPIIYEMIDQPMPEEMDHPLPVFKLSSREEALFALTLISNEEMLPLVIADGLVSALGVGTSTGLAAVHAKMRGRAGWPDVEAAKAQTPAFKEIIEMFAQPVEASGYAVQMTPAKNQGGQLKVEIWEADDE